MLKAVIFDLDDTLYEERQFFQSGFAVVGEHLEQRGVGSWKKTAEMLSVFHHTEGRQQVFQKLAKQLGFPEEWIPPIVDLFRLHTPVIQLAPEVRDVLVRIRNINRLQLGCITDGWLEVQRRKINALGIQPLLDQMVIADEFGREFWKPHARPFQTCCARLGVEPAEAMFIGDNPERDMIGARRAGLTTVRIRRPGAFFEMAESEIADAQPDFEIRLLNDLEPLLARFRAGTQALT